jgi:hypothetical protein
MEVGLKLLNITSSTAGINEHELFVLLKKRLFPDLEKFDGTFHNADCFSFEDKLYIELKCRRTHYDELIIEEYKYERLVNLAMDMDYSPVYVNSTPLGVWAFNLGILLPRWEDRDNLPATTEFENTQKVVKSVGYLNIKDGVRLW